MIRMTKAQARRAHALVRNRCSNCYDGRYCLLLDGEVCAQLIRSSGVCCKFFRDTVLPAEKELYEELMKNVGESK